MIYMLGDIHGNFSKLDWLKQHVQPEDTVIQVGDFGIYPKLMLDHKMHFAQGYPCRVLVIDGNHEDFNIINTYSKNQLTPLGHNFFYVPRGYVMEIENQLFGFLGGAESIDKVWRANRRDWFHEERVTDADIDTLYANVGDRQLDVLVTHSPPNFVNQAHFPPLNFNDWGLPLDWIDETAWKISKVNIKLKPKKHYCGHMHKAVLHGNVRILDINEVLQHDSV